MIRNDDLSPKEKAAILMVALGKKHSSEVYKHLSDEEIEQLTLNITSLRRVEQDVKDDILKEFFEICVAQKFITEGGIDYARQVLIDAFGSERADELIGRLSASLQVRPFDFVRKSDPSQVLNFIQSEHPQTIALILSYLDSKQAALILSALSVEVQADVVQRIAIMTVSSPEFVREAERILERKLSSAGLEENLMVGGVSAIVEILNAVDRSTERMILETIEQENPELADEIHKRMFVFEDIVKLSNVDLQKTLKEVQNADLTVALKGASEEIKEKIFSNMSKRLQEMIREEMDYLGPVRVRDVEEAQQKIVTVIRKLEDSGEIEIARGADDEVVI